MRYAEVPLALQTDRVISVDALRGFSIFWIIGADGAIWTLERILRDKGPALSAAGGFLGVQLRHVEWEGLTFYDFIFPLFIFVTGVSIVLALPRLVEQEGRAGAHLHVLRRATLLYVLGLIFYGGLSQHWSDIRFVGVLQAGRSFSRGKLVWGFRLDLFRDADRAPPGGVGPGGVGAAGAAGA